jgi:hypothetical protein
MPEFVPSGYLSIRDALNRLGRELFQSAGRAKSTRHVAEQKRHGSLQRPHKPDSVALIDRVAPCLRCTVMISALQPRHWLELANQLKSRNWSLRVFRRIR